MESPESSPQAFAHDLRNLLGIILGYADMLLAEVAADSPHRADICEMKKAAKSALALLETVSRSSSPQERA